MNFNQDINKISDFLYISNWETSNNPYVLKKYNIKAIITIETHRKSNEILDYYKENNIDYLFLYLYDLPSEDISKYFDISFAFIDKHIKKGENVLVHCMAGISRSSTLILNYLIRKYYERYNYSSKCSNCIVNYFLQLCRLKRPIINPNPGFITQLKNYYN
jgi:protein tyrosine phosphatase